MKTELATTTVDDRRRVVLPKSCPTNVPVIIQEIDSETWLVKMAHPASNVVFVPFERIERLPDDPDWEKFEESAARHASEKLPPPNFE